MKPKVKEMKLAGGLTVKVGRKATTPAVAPPPAALAKPAPAVPARARRNDALARKELPAALRAAPKRRAKRRERVDIGELARTCVQALGSVGKTLAGALATHGPAGTSAAARALRKARGTATAAAKKTTKRAAPKRKKAAAAPKAAAKKTTAKKKTQRAAPKRKKAAKG